MYLNLAAKRKNKLFLQVVCCHYNSSKNVFSTKKTESRAYIPKSKKASFKALAKLNIIYITTKKLKYISLL
jgi:hypothetical protein